jgi:hypothetical protein
MWQRWNKAVPSDSTEPKKTEMETMAKIMTKMQQQQART